MLRHPHAPTASVGPRCATTCAPSVFLRTRRVCRRVVAAEAATATSEQDEQQQHQELGRTPAGEVVVSIEAPSFTSRRIFAATAIRAPPDAVWRALTDYDGLGEFIPSLVENRCLERGDGGALLYQVGAQDVAMGMKFRAATTLRIGEHPAGLPAERCLVGGSGGDNSGSGFHDKLYPFPSQWLPDQPVHGDITFDQVDGDFNAFKGVWRIQPGLQGPASAWLVYALYVRPQPWLPVGLIQDRIAREVVANLQAVQRHTERLHLERSGAAAAAAGSGAGGGGSGGEGASNDGNGAAAN